ncbi:hypothetical protein TNCV_3940441 [Trichonephila clavipes]|uniref:Uncharacterized protein n=1 Tax=Trichonephila clavipes TaxID=2585209 RepID=A0A8X6VVL1_TRICX|nr:hypothetical protein TNCV_3940441 [Trichonephila clavipes]
MGHLELKNSSGWHRSRIERIDVFPFFSPDGTFRVEELQWDGIVQGLERIDVFPFFLLMGHLELKNSSGWHRSRIERIDVFPFFFSPDGTFRVEELQWMTSFKDWRELMCFRFFLMGHLELKTPVDDIVQGLERIDVFPFFLLMGHLELKDSSG